MILWVYKEKYVICCPDLNDLSSKMVSDIANILKISNIANGKIIVALCVEGSLFLISVA